MFRLAAMLALIAVRAVLLVRGEGRACGPADDADGTGELDPVGVDVGFGGCLADQGADRVVGEQVAVDLLPHHVRAFGPQHPPWPAQVGLELVVAGFVLPPFVICLRKQRGWGGPGVGDRGDQRDQLAVAVTITVGHLILDHPHRHRPGLIEVFAGTGGVDERLPCLAPILGLTSTDR